MTGERSRWVNPLIGVFLAFQVVMPLSYYLGDHDYDERFSWRMFSTRRMARCQVAVQETLAGPAGPTTRAVSLGKTLQVAWVNILKRYRPAVVEKFLHVRCAAGGGVDSVRYVRRCTDTTGAPLPTVTVSLSCADRTLEVDEGVSDTAAPGAPR